MDDKFVNMFGNAVAVATAKNFKRHAGKGWKAKLYSYACYFSIVITEAKKSHAPKNN